MRIVAWNIRHGGSNHRDLAASIMAHDPDVVVLGEHQHEKSSALVDSLRLFGWAHGAASLTSLDDNGVALLSRIPLESRPPPFGPERFARWGVEAQLGDLMIVGVYAPLPGALKSSRYQREFWHAVHGMVEARRAERVVMIGDYNTCAAVGDGPGALACSNAFERLSEFGWVDAWRASNPGATDFSYIQLPHTVASEWRIDQAFVSPPLAKAVRGCRYSHRERQAGLSDHSIMILDLASDASS